MGRSNSANNKNTAKGRGKALQGAGRALRANEGKQVSQVDYAPLMDSEASRDIVAVVLAVASVISFIAVVSNADEPVSGAISSFFHLGFGLGAYVIPLAFLLFSASLFWRDRSPLNVRSLSGAVLILVAVLGILSLLVPNTSLSTAGMFEPAALATSGGYVGAFVASVLQKALGKTIAMVALVGIIIVALVVIGFSISDFVQTTAEHARALAERRRVNVNDMPWGEQLGAFGGAAAHMTQNQQAAQAPQELQPAQAAAFQQGSIFDDAGSAETTFLGNRETTVLEPRVDAEPDEDPFVDVSVQIEAERAKTTLIPVCEHFVHNREQQEVDAAPAHLAQADVPAFDVISAPALSRTVSQHDLGEEEALSEVVDEPAEITPTSVATANGPRPIPAFLQASRADAQADSREQAKTPTSADSASEQASSKVNAVQATPQLKASATTDASDEDEEARKLPPLSMLRHNPKSATAASSKKELEQTAQSLQSTLNEFGLHAQVVGWLSGPTVTTFKVQPGEGERVSRISNLEDDIALSLAAQSVRIFAPIPGTSLVGIEIPNAKRQNVNLGDVLPYAQGAPLELAIGRDAEGTPVVADLAKMPHLLIAGTTGSGKSVMINSIVMALLMRTFPEDVRLIMVDPKRVELSGYNGLPHLYVPVVTEPKQAASALQWGVSEMERRLKVFERIGVRNIATFNTKQAAGEFEHYDNPPQKMPYLVIIIDELSDLMMVAGKDVEASIVRIAQLGRAAGIHLIVATQRPSSNVVTGLIKANITNRIAFNVATGIDSRVIIDQMGAEKLTGYGDMLFSKVDWGKPKRIQGCFVSDDEINGVVEFVKEQGAPDYHEEILSAVAPAQMGGGSGGTFYNEAPSEDDPLLWDAAKIVVDSQLGSTSGLQRRLKVGYARAGRIMDMLEEKGIVGPPDGSKPREVLLDEEGLAALRAVEEQLSEEEIRGGM